MTVRPEADAASGFVTSDEAGSTRSGPLVVGLADPPPATNGRRERLLTEAQVAKAFGVRAATVGRWARSGRLPFQLSPSGRRRYQPTDVARLLAKPATDGD